MTHSTKTVCGQVVCTLKQMNKPSGTYSRQEVEAALREANITSVGSFRNYMGTDGYLIKGNFLHRRIGGWQITEESKDCKKDCKKDCEKDCGKITVSVYPKQLTRAVCKEIRANTKQFGDIIRITIQEG